MKRITFKWSANKCGDEENAKGLFSSSLLQMLRYSGGKISDFYDVKPPPNPPRLLQLTAFQLSLTSPLVKKPGGPFQTQFILYFGEIYVNNLVTVRKMEITNPNYCHSIRAYYL